MRGPLFLWVVLASFALPVLAAAGRWPRLDRPMRLVAAWYGLLIVENLVSIGWARWVDPASNLAVPQFFMPVEALLILAALAEWQPRPVARIAARIAIPLYLVAWALALVFIEGIGRFSTFSGPVLGLLVLAFALTAFIGLQQRSEVPVLETAWGWTLPGLAIFFSINATATIVMAMAFRAGDMALMVNVSLLRASIYLFATLLVTTGVLWPTRLRSSGASSSPLPSR